MQLTLDKLLDRFLLTGDVNSTIEYAKSFIPNYPKINKKPRLSSLNASLEEIEEYKILLKNHEEYEKDKKIQLDEYTKIEKMITSLIIDFIKEVSGLNNIPEQYRSRVYSRAYEEGHSYGYYEVYQVLRNLVEIFE